MVVLEERRSGSTSPTETRKYVWGAAGLAYMASSLGNVDVYHTDGLGSVRAISDASAQVVQTYATDEFGIPTDTQGSLRQGFQWTGEERDENDLVFLRARDYLPDLGRFLQADPLRKSAPGIGGWNRYGYVGNNPVCRTDPSGLTPSADPEGGKIVACQPEFSPPSFSGFPFPHIEPGQVSWVCTATKAPCKPSGSGGINVVPSFSLLQPNAAFFEANGVGECEGEQLVRVFVTINWRTQVGTRVVNRGRVFGEAGVTGEGSFTFTSFPRVGDSPTGAGLVSASGQATLFFTGNVNLIITLEGGSAFVPRPQPGPPPE